MSVTAALAEYVTHSTYEAIPRDVRDEAKRRIHPFAGTSELPISAAGVRASLYTVSRGGGGAVRAHRILLCSRSTASA